MSAKESLVGEDYASSEDSDFAPQDDAPDRASSPDSIGEADPAATREATGSKKRQAGEAEDGDGDADFENSGDEAVIVKGRKRQKKTRGHDGVADDDEGGEGGLIKTRSQRAQEKAERKAAAVTGPVTIDVDALWAQMTSAPDQFTSTAEHANDSTEPSKDANNSGKDAARQGGEPATKRQEGPEMIKIKRTYNFAGKVQTEEKLVARDSAEARLYLATQGDKAITRVDGDDEPAKRMPRRAFRSIFEPVLDGATQRTDLNLGMTVRLQARELAKENAKKLNVVEKSRMDWAGYVDQEGIKDELELAGKSKASFAERQQFLARSEARREDEARRARIAGRAA